MNKSIREWARVVYEQAKRNGFHASEEDVTLREKVGTFAMNLHAEISELWEAFRKGQLFELCDKAEKMKAMGLRPLTCIEEELADIHIRNMDMAEDFKIDLEEAVEIKHAYNGTRPFRHGNKLA